MEEFIETPSNQNDLHWWVNSYELCFAPSQRGLLSLLMSTLKSAISYEFGSLYCCYQAKQPFQNQTNNNNTNTDTSITDFISQVFSVPNAPLKDGVLILDTQSKIANFLTNNNLENPALLEKSSFFLFAQKYPDGLYLVLTIVDSKPIHLNNNQVELINENLSGIIKSIPKIAGTPQSNTDFCFLQRVINLIPQLIYLKNENGYYLLANKALANLYNTTPERLIGKKQEEFHKNKEELLQYLKDDSEVIKQNRNKYNPEESFTDADGNKLFFQTLKAPFTLREGDKTLMGIGVDITEQMITTEALIESQQSLEEAQRISHIGNFNYNVLTNKIFCSAQIYNILGLSSENEIISYHDFTSLVHPDDAEIRQVSIDKASKAQENYQHEYRILRADGSTINVCENAEFVRTNEGKISNIIGTIQDISERKQFELEILSAKKKAEEADELKSALLSTFSHNARYPLNSILVFTELLINPRIDDNKKSKFVQIINNSGKSLISLIDNIIDISRIETGQFQLSEGETDVNKMLNDILIEINQQKEEAKKNNVEIILLDIIHRDMFIQTDGVRLKMAIYNLLLNALKYSDKGTIKFGYTLEGNNGLRFLRFYVKDAGVGVLNSQIEKIFDGKNQLDNIRNNNKDTSGLGLVIAKKVIELLGGKIWIESVVGSGSTFYFTIPYQKIERQPALKLRGNQPYNWEDKVILIAEDDDDNYRFLKEILNQTKAHIIRASNGVESIEFIEGQKYKLDLILMDIKMPLMDGYEATRRIKELRSDIPIIAQTAFADLEEKEKSFRAGCVAHISKPIQVNELLVTIEKFI